MPTYEFKCPDCSSRASKILSYKEAETWFGNWTAVPGLDNVKCANCDTAMKRIFSAPAVIIH